MANSLEKLKGYIASGRVTIPRMPAEMDDDGRQPGWPLRSQLYIAAGTTLEWYDFMLYAYLTPVMSELFFPKDVTGSELGSLLATFGVFAAEFLVRPLGAIFLGRYGDTYGRRRALLLSLVLMTLPILAIGLLPTYDEIGWAAPALLLVLRLITGFAVGGEFSGELVALTESARQDRRGYAAATAHFTSGIGVLIASALVAILHAVLSNAQMADFGWRVPFLVGAALGVAALVLRRHMRETTSFEAAQQAGVLAANPLGEALRRERGPLFYAFMLTAYMGVGYYRGDLHALLSPEPPRRQAGGGLHRHHGRGRGLRIPRTGRRRTLRPGRTQARDARGLPGPTGVHLARLPPDGRDLVLHDRVRPGGADRAGAALHRAVHRSGGRSSALPTPTAERASRTTWGPPSSPGRRPSWARRWSRPPATSRRPRST
jgi:MFS family permease